MKNTDTRVQYTKHALQQALLEVLKDKSIARVTVKEVCEKANINRGTFYLHYSTPNDILREIEQKFLEENLSIFTDYMIDASHEKRNDSIDKLQSLFRVTLENIEVCRVIFGPNGEHHFFERIKNNLKPEVIGHWCFEFPEYKKEHLEYIYDYVFNGSMSLIFNWMDNQDISVELLANRLDRLGHYAHLAIREFK